MIAIDFDGVLAQYDGWKGEEVVGEPLPGAIGFLHYLQHEKIPFAIFSTRKAEVIQKWLNHHRIYNVEVTDKKDNRFHVFLDDRAFCFLPSMYANINSLAQMLTTFEPHWKKHQGQH